MQRAFEDVSLHLPEALIVGGADGTTRQFQMIGRLRPGVRAARVGPLEAPRVE